MYFEPPELTFEEVPFEQVFIPIPSHRLTPLRKNWEIIFTPIVENLKLEIMFNTVTKNIEMRTCRDTENPQAIRMASDFIHAFNLGFDVRDAIAILRLDNIYIDSFDITEVRQTLHGDNLSRAIGRIAGKNGKTKFAIEHATRTRIVLAGTLVHILGAFNNLTYARDSICSLILGTPPSKVYNQLKIVQARINEGL